MRWVRVLAALLLATAEDASPAPPTSPYLLDYEAAGSFRHVAGSACCHPEAEEAPLEGGPGACERRCVGRSACDAFVFAPSTRLCFLIRFGDPSGAGDEEARRPKVRPAPERIFGLVRYRSSSGGSDGSGSSGNSAVSSWEETPAASREAGAKVEAEGENCSKSEVAGASEVVAAAAPPAPAAAKVAGAPPSEPSCICIILTALVAATLAAVPAALWRGAGPVEKAAVLVKANADRKDAPLPSCKGQLPPSPRSFERMAALGGR